jgi:hypothetical protein
MPHMEKSTAPLDFSASFPADARFAPTAAELAAKLAQATGCAEGDSQDLRLAVDGAFQRALSGAPVNGASASIDLVLRSTDASFATDLTCGDRTLLHVTHSRPA